MTMLTTTEILPLETDPHGVIRVGKTRVTLDVTRGANDKHTPAEWTAIAASARMPGLARRPVSVYLAEVASDEMLRAVAAPG